MLSTKPTVSAVIPTHNRPDYLASAIESVLSQTYPVCEVIVVDDGSEGDETRLAVESFNDDRIQYIRFETPRGGCAARNTGIETSTGDLIAFLDDDDRWLPEKIEKQVEVFLRDEEVGLVYCKIREVDADSGKEHSLTKTAFLRGWIHAEVLVANQTERTSTWLVRRECFQKAGYFDVDFPSYQEWDMITRLSVHYKVDYADEELILWTVHGLKISRDYGKLLVGQRLFQEKKRKECRQVGLLFYGKVMSEYYNTRGGIYRYANERLKSILCHFAGAFYWPFGVQNYLGVIKAVLDCKLRKKILQMLIGRPHLSKIRQPFESPVEDNTKGLESIDD